MRSLSKVLLASLVISTPALFFACNPEEKDDGNEGGSGGTDTDGTGGKHTGGGSNTTGGTHSGGGTDGGGGIQNLGGGGMGGIVSTGGTGGSDGPTCFIKQTAAEVDCSGFSGTELFDRTDCIGANGPTDAVKCYSDQGAFVDDADWMEGWTNWSMDSTPEDNGCDSDGPILACASGVCEYPKGVYDLVGQIYVTDGATIKFAPGTIIRGAASPKGSLIISRGGKIDAVGTAEEPIIFTSSAPNGSKTLAGWGGILLLGKAVNWHGPTFNIEGLATVPENQHGGSDDNDDSGTLKYVRIEFGGVDLGGGNEINGLSLGSIGSETDISYVQVNTTLDDGFEFFGGTVDADHLVVNNAGDDIYDADDGYRGTLSTIFGRHVISVTDSPNGFEIDGDQDAGAKVDDVNTTGHFENATLCTDTTNDNDANIGYGAVLRQHFGGTLDGIVLSGFDFAIDLRNNVDDLEVTNAQVWDFGLGQNDTNPTGLVFNLANNTGTTAPTDGNGDPADDEDVWFDAESSNEILDP